METETIVSLIFVIIFILGVLLQISYYFRDKKIKKNAYAEWQNQRNLLTKNIKELINLPIDIDSSTFNDDLKKHYLHVKSVAATGQHSRYKSIHEAETVYFQILESLKAEKLLKEKYKQSGLFQKYQKHP